MASYTGVTKIPQVLWDVNEIKLPRAPWPTIPTVIGTAVTLVLLGIVVFLHLPIPYAEWGLLLIPGIAVGLLSNHHDIEGASVLWLARDVALWSFSPHRYIGGRSCSRKIRRYRRVVRARVAHA